MTVRRLLLTLVALAAAAAAQTTTTVTGTIKDLAGNVVTSGQVTFDLQPGADTTISGSGRFVPTTITCLINGSGQLATSSGSGSCVVTQNTALTPAGTYYLVTLWPDGVPASKFNWYAVGPSQDISTVVPTPATLPAYTFVATGSDQSIGGQKTFTTGIAGRVIGGVVYADQFTGADIGAKINAAVSSLTHGCGTVVVPAGDYTYGTTAALARCTVLAGQSGGYAGGGTSLTYTGSGAAVAVGDSDTTDSLASAVPPVGGIRDLTLVGPSASGSSIGVYLGGDPAGAITPSSDYANGVSLRDVQIRGFGTGLQFGNNAWLDSVTNARIQYNGVQVAFPDGISNSGESTVFLHVMLGDSPTSGDSMLIDTPDADVVYSAGSIDSGPVVLTANAGGSHLALVGVHMENNTNTDYNFLSIAQGDVTITASSLLNDGMTGTGSTFIEVSGGSVSWVNSHAQTLGATVSAVIEGSSASAKIGILGSAIAVGNFTAVVSGTYGPMPSFGLMQVGADQQGGVSGFNGLLTGHYSTTCQGLQWESFGVVSSTPFICQAPGADSTRLNIGQGANTYIALNSSGLSFPLGATVPTGKTISGGTVNADVLEQNGVGVFSADMNSSAQVVASHLSAPLPPAQGGTGVNSTAVFPSSGTVATVLSGTTASIGGSALGAGTCTSGTATVAGVSTAMALAVTPAADPGAGFLWQGFVSATNTVTVRVCNVTSGSLTPAAQAYNVRVIQ